MAQGWFAETIWTQILQAKQRDTASLEALIRSYRPGVERFIRNRGFQEADAQDIAQEVFLRIVQDELLERADKGRGRFRSLLLGITKNVISDWRRHKGRLKRGGGATVESLESGAGADDATRWAELIAANEKDEEFDHEWASNLLRVAMDRMREACEREATPYFSVLLLYMNEDLTYAQVGERLGFKETDVRNYLHKGRKDLRTHLEALIREYSSSESEFQEDCAYLLQRLSAAD